MEVTICKTNKIISDSFITVVFKIVDIEISKNYTREPLWKNGDVIVTSFYLLQYDGAHVYAKDHPDMTEIENRGSYVYSFSLEGHVLFEV